MSREFAKAFYGSKQWQECRESYTRSKRYLCEDCLVKGLYTPGEIVHHIKELSPENINDPMVTLNFDNLRLVCRKCHAEEHQQRDRRYIVDEYGRVYLKQEKLAEKRN